MLNSCFKEFRTISSGEAARTRLVAKRSLKECDVVARDETTTTERKSKWPWSCKVVETVLVGQRNGKECDCTVFFSRRLKMPRYVQDEDMNKEWAKGVALRAEVRLNHSLMISTSW